MSENFWWYNEDFCPSQAEVLRVGSKGQAVEILQTLLKKAGYKIGVDGDFGPKTEGIVIQFQRAKGLVADGIAGEKTIAALLDKKEVCNKFLTQKDLAWAAEQLKVPVAAVMAVNEVESRGRGFLNDGRTTILYERHIMRRRLIEYKIDPVPHIAKQPDIVNSKAGGYLGGVREYPRLDRARVIHDSSGLESCSWGAYQIMGFHAKRIGYKNVQEMVSEMAKSERKQLEAFVRFIQADNNLLRSLRNLDWATFARWYNGPNYAINKYDTKLATAFNQHTVKLMAA